MNAEMKFVYLKNHPLFSNTSEEKIRQACSMAKAKTLPRGEVFNYGDSSYSKVYLLLEGKVKIRECNELENDLVKDILIGPDIFGNLSLDLNYEFNEFAEALTSNTIVCYFAVADFRHFMQDNPFVALSYAHMVNGKLKKLEGRHSDLMYRDAKSRLIRFMKTWALTDGNRVGNKIVLKNYLTHSDIAGVIATSRQSVNVMLNELRDSGMLFYDRKRIELNNSVGWN